MDHLVSKIKPAAAVPALFNRCENEVALWAASQLCAEPIAPWSHQIRCDSSGYRKIPKFYVECAEDCAVTLKQQLAMRKLVPCDFVMTLTADHSPFLSRPSELADALGSINQNTSASQSLWMTRQEDEKRPSPI
jgi:hypothetical protein